MPLDSIDIEAFPFPLWTISPLPHPGLIEFSCALVAVFGPVVRSNQRGKRVTLKNNPPWVPEKKFSFGDVVLLYKMTAYYLVALP